METKKDGNSLSEDEKREVLAQDAVICDRGSLMSAVQTNVTSVKNWDRNLEVTDEPYAQHQNEVIELISNTPCARARGVLKFGLSGASRRLRITISP